MGTSQSSASNQQKVTLVNYNNGDKYEGKPFETIFTLFFRRGSQEPD